MWIALIGLLGPFGAGVTFIFSTVTLPNYQAEDEAALLNTPLTDDQASWFGKKVLEFTADSHPA